MAEPGSAVDLDPGSVFAKAYGPLQDQENVSRKGSIISILGIADQETNLRVECRYLCNERTFSTNFLLTKFYQWEGWDFSMDTKMWISCNFQIWTYCCSLIFFNHLKMWNLFLAPRPCKTRQWARFGLQPQYTGISQIWIQRILDLTTMGI